MHALRCINTGCADALETDGPRLSKPEREKLERLPATQKKSGPRATSVFTRDQAAPPLPQGFSLGQRTDEQELINDAEARQLYVRAPPVPYRPESTSIGIAPPSCRKGSRPVVLALFAGRRRDLDLQHAIETAFAAAGMLVTVLSYDLVYGPERDLLDPANIKFLLEVIAQGLVLAVLLGPPCETWSIARFVELILGRPGPPPLRSGAEPWGLPGVSDRQRGQIQVGSKLLQTGLELMLAVYSQGGIFLLEHPAPLSKHVDVDAPSIWALPEVIAIEGMVGVARVDMQQGRFGAKSPTPTSWLVGHAPSFSQALDAFDTGSLAQGTSIGIDAGGAFETAVLKEYPQLLCQAIGKTLVTEAQRAGLDASVRHHLDDTLIGMIVPLDPYFEMGLDFGGGSLFD